MQLMQPPRPSQPGMIGSSRAPWSTYTTPGMSRWVT